MAEEKQKKFSLATEEGVNEVIDHVANEMLNGRMTKSSADPVNTTIKLRFNFMKLKRDYMSMFLEAAKWKIRKGEMEPEQALAQLPKFFTTESLPQIEQQPKKK